MSVCFQRMPKSSSWTQIAFAYGAGLPGVVGHGRVEVGDLAQAVTAQLERVGPLADQVLPRVEVRLPVAEPRVAVRHDHLGDRGAVHHRALVQADLVQGQALAGVEPDPHGPVLPLEPRPVQNKRRSLGLGDLDRAQRGALRAAYRLVVVVAGLGRDRQLELVGDLEDLLLDQVDVGRDAVHRVGPGQVVLAGLDEGEHAHHPPPVVLGRSEGAGGDRAGPDLADVVQAAPGHGRAPARVGLDDLVHELEVAVQDRHLAVGGRVQRARADDLGAGQRDHHVGRLAGGGVDQERAQPAVGRFGVEHVVLGRFGQPVVGEPDRLGQQPGGRHDLPPGQVLGAGGRVQRVWGGSAGRLAGADGGVGHGGSPRGAERSPVADADPPPGRRVIRRR